jgi:hypothetical protein
VREPVKYVNVSSGHIKNLKYVLDWNVIWSFIGDVMPQIPVKIEEAEQLDSKIEGMCKDKSAILVSPGGTFANIFPKATDRSKVYRNKYMIALGTGRLLFTKTAEISIYFDYRDMSAEIQITRRGLEDVDDILPEIRGYLYRMCSAGERVEKLA